MKGMLPSVIGIRVHQATNSAKRVLHGRAHGNEKVVGRSENDDLDILKPVTFSLFVRLSLAVLLGVGILWRVLSALQPAPPATSPAKSTRR